MQPLPLGALRMASCLIVMFCLSTPDGLLLSVPFGGGPSETPNIPPFLGGLYCVILTIFVSMFFDFMIYVLITVLCPLLFYFSQLPPPFSLLLLILLGTRT